MAHGRQKGAFSPTGSLCALFRRTQRLNELADARLPDAPSTVDPPCHQRQQGQTGGGERHQPRNRQRRRRHRGKRIARITAARQGVEIFRRDVDQRFIQNGDQQPGLPRCAKGKAQRFGIDARKNFQ